MRGMGDGRDSEGERQGDTLTHGGMNERERDKKKKKDVVYNGVI